MCSIIGTTKNIDDLNYVNYFTKFRGPDHTGVRSCGPFTLVHNLLSITGASTEQPLLGDKTAVIFNGEIYNYNAFGDYKSDGEVLLPLYRERGVDFVSKLDGEFAILLVDEARGEYIVSTDVFGTKPLWIAFDEEGHVGVASYESALHRLGFKRTGRVPPNTTRVYKFKTNELLHEQRVHSFELEQHVGTYDKFVDAFVDSIKKRSRNMREKIFLGLSSGYDSGAIAAELEEQGVLFKVYTVLGRENGEVLEERMKLHDTHEPFDLSYQEFVTAKRYLVNHAEDVYLSIMPERNRGHYVSDNDGAVALSAICLRARQEGYRVFFSGQGADEIFADYGHAGKKFTAHSSFGGLFPEDLSTIFPWPSVFGGTQRAYLDKEEAVAGSHGIETRYPFLDTQAVQEFLSLKPELKNRHYKAPLYHYLDLRKYPVEKKKIGFVAREYTKLEKLHPRALFFRVYWHLLRLKRNLSRK